MFKAIIFTLSGVCTLCFIFILALISAPIYLYRILMTKFLARVPFLKPKNLGKAVTVFGSGLAVEFLGKRSTSRATRCCIVLNLLLEGEILSKSELTEQIKNVWINVKDQNGNLIFPEFQQYIGSWMGFMFWKWEKTFQLENHIYIHKIPEDSSISSEDYQNNLIENLVNKPFPVGKSPWEVHLIQNYKVISKEDQEMYQSVLILRIHHAMADGYSILYTLLNKLCHLNGLDEMEEKVYRNLHSKISLKEKFFNFVRIPFRILYDIGYIGSLYLRPKTGWHINDQNKSWHQLYHRSNLIPISKVKNIKNKFKVSFTSVILSCLASALAKMEQTKCNGKICNKIVTTIFLPLPGHSEKLRNHFTATMFDLPVNPNLTPVTRLNICEANIQEGKSSMIPLILKSLFVPVILSQLAPIAKYFSKNRVIPAGISNFRASDIGIGRCMGRKVVMTDYATGAALGDSGLAFQIPSYADHVRIGATAENSVVTREELEQLLGWVEDEIDKLCELKSDLVIKEVVP